jgi:hypothetical protein
MERRLWVLGSGVAELSSSDAVGERNREDAEYLRGVA